MANHSRVLAWRIPWTEGPTVHAVAKSWTQLSDQHTYTHKIKVTLFYKFEDPLLVLVNQNGAG